MTAPDRSLPDPAVEPTIPVARAAAIAGCGLRTAYALVERGLWPSIHLGRRVVLPTARWLKTVGLADT